MGGRRQVRAVGRTRGGRGLARNPRNRGGLPPGRVDALAGWRSKDGDGNRRAVTHCLSSGTATPMLKRPLVRPADRCAARSECPTAGDFLLTLGASARICFLHFYASQDKYLATPALPSQSSPLSTSPAIPPAWRTLSSPRLSSPKRRRRSFRSSPGAARVPSQARKMCFCFSQPPPS